MTDKEFERLMKKTKKVQERYMELLNQCEEEYMKRFGHHPSDIDDDSWIDVMHYPQGGVCFDDMMQKAKESADRANEC